MAVQEQLMHIANLIGFNHVMNSASSAENTAENGPAGVETNLQPSAQMQSDASPQAVAAATPGPGNLDKSAKAGQEILEAGKQDAQKVGNSVLQDQDAAYETGKKAIDTRLAHETEVENALKLVYEDANKKLAKLDERFDTTWAEASTQKKAGLDKYLTAVEDLKNTHIYNWWDQASTGAKILGVISQALAGGLQGMTGQSGPTPLDRAIEQGVQIQKANAAIKSDVAQQSGGLYKDLLSQLKDEVLAEGALRDIAYNSTKQRVLNQAAAIGGDALVKAQDFAAQLDERMAQNRANIQLHVAKLGWDGAVQRTGLQKEYEGIWTTRQGQGLAYQAHMATTGQASGVVGVKHWEEYQKSDKEGARDLENKMVATKQAVAVVDDISRKLRTTVTNPDDTKRVIIKDDSSLSVDDKRALDQMIDQALLKVKDMNKLGAISERDYDLSTAVVGEDNGWAARFMRGLGFRSYAAMFNRLKTFQDNAQRDIKTAIENKTVIDPATGQRVRLQYDPNATE